MFTNLPLISWDCLCSGWDQVRDGGDSHLLIFRNKHTGSVKTMIITDHIHLCWVTAERHSIHTDVCWKYFSKVVICLTPSRLIFSVWLVGRWFRGLCAGLCPIWPVTWCTGRCERLSTTIWNQQLFEQLTKTIMFLDVIASIYVLELQHCCPHCPTKFLLESEFERCSTNQLEMTVTFTQTQTQDCTSVQCS